MPRRKLFLSQDFTKRMREHLAMEAKVWHTDIEGHPGPTALDAPLKENTFYHLDGSAFSAWSAAVEDMALQEKGGSLLVLFPSPELFDHFKERYLQLAREIKEVQAILPEKHSRRSSVLHLRAPQHQLAEPFWMVSFEGRQNSVLAIGQLMRPDQDLSETLFKGFFTFDGRISTRLREELETQLQGSAVHWAEFRRLEQIDRAAKVFQAELLKEGQAIEAAVQKLQSNGPHYSVKHFSADLDEALQRLQSIKETLTAHLGRPNLAGEDQQGTFPWNWR